MPAKLLVQVLIKFYTQTGSTGMGRSQAGRDQSIPSQLALLGALVKLAEQGVDDPLLIRRDPQQDRTDPLSHVFHGSPNSIPIIAGIPAISQFECLG
tara:strand:+ start:462 stop:752 length:291 start_codon:yes stop_codon:yes gene_type:complete